MNDLTQSYAEQQKGDMKDSSVTNSQVGANATPSGTLIERLRNGIAPGTCDLCQADSTISIRCDRGDCEWDFNLKLETASALTTLTRIEQVCYDLHAALGVKWGEDPYAVINTLKAAEAQVATLTQRAEVAEGREIKLEAGKSLAEHERNEARQQVDALMRERDEWRESATAAAGLLMAAVKRADAADRAGAALMREKEEQRERLLKAFGHITKLEGEKEESQLERDQLVFQVGALEVDLEASRENEDALENKLGLVERNSDALMRQKEERNRAGYVLAMELLQSSIQLDDEARSAQDGFLNSYRALVREQP